MGRRLRVEEKGVSSIIVVTAVVVVIVAGVGGYFLLKGKATGPLAKPLLAFALNAEDMPWLENIVENEVSEYRFGVIENEFSVSQLSEWGEDGLYEKGIYQLNPNFNPNPGTPGKGSVAYQLIVRFKDAGGAINCYEFVEPLFVNDLGAGENLTFVSAGDRGFIIDDGVFVVWLQHSNLVVGLVIAKNYCIESSAPGDFIPGITKDNALAIAQTVYNKMIS
jgi:hypothetical protein